MRITLPLPQKVSTNTIYAGVHWAKRKEMADLFQMALLPFRRKPAPTPCELFFSFTFKKAPLDCSNCAYMVKMLEDGMVMNEILPDDSTQYVKRIHIISEKGTSDSVTIEAVKWTASSV